MRHSVRGFLLLATATLVTKGAHAQGLRANTADWCADATTVCWSDTRSALAGFRLVFEPQLGVLVQSGDNKFESTNFNALEKIGVAFPLYGRQLGVQVLFIYPSTIQFDEQSPIRVSNAVLDDADGKVDVEWGLTIGVTVLDGVLSTGVGFLRYDRRDFRDPDTLPKSVFRDSFSTSTSRRSRRSRARSSGNAPDAQGRPPVDVIPVTSGRRHSLCVSDGSDDYRSVVDVAPGVCQGRVRSPRLPRHGRHGERISRARPVARPFGRTQGDAPRPGGDTRCEATARA